MQLAEAEQAAAQDHSSCKLQHLSAVLQCNPQQHIVVSYSSLQLPPILAVRGVAATHPASETVHHCNGHECAAHIDSACDDGGQQGGITCLAGSLEQLRSVEPVGQHTAKGSQKELLAGLECKHIVKQAGCRVQSNTARVIVCRQCWFTTVHAQCHTV